MSVMASAAPEPEAHVPTAVYCCQGYANDTVPPSSAAPFVTWATTGDAGARADRAAGIENTVDYVDVGRVYQRDRAYPLVAAGRFAAARAVNCAGQPITTSPAGFMTDPFKPETLSLLDDELAHAYSPAFSAYFLDDVDAFRWGMTNGFPCRGNPPAPWSEPSASYAYGALLGGVRIGAGDRSIAPNIIMNGLSQYADRPAMHAIPLNVMRAANVIGGMCEGCLADNSPDKLKGGEEWQDDVDLEIKTVRMHKIFWDYVRYLANDPHARLYTFASFMLAWDPRYTVYQTAYQPVTAGQLHVTPETQLVAHDPIKGGYDSVSGLRDGEGTYVREYRQCYYRQNAIGACAFVVNSDSGAHPAPLLAQRYGHTMTVEGGMVLEGGHVSLDGPAMPQTVPGMTGFVLTR